MSAVQGAAEARAVQLWIASTSTAAAQFERRWTRSALARIDASLAKRLAMQIQDFDRVLVTGTVDEIAEQGSATVRGWNVCREAMEGSAEPDDAYVLGFDAVSGVRVAIGNQRAAAHRVAELHGKTVTWLSADEVAGLLAGLDTFRTAEAVKKIWPGAVVRTHLDEPAQDEEAA